jgi:drug/metabolite transporter (DMT)-like permease
MSVLFFHERMRPVQWAGIRCILSGVLAVNS